MLRLIISVLILNVLSFSTFCFGQEDYSFKMPEVVPPTPEIAGLGKYIETPVNEFTGIPRIGMPIYAIQQGRINHSINLSYHAQGVKVEEIASRVGMGWTLNAGGVIHRQMKKLPDNINHGFLMASESLNDLANAIANPYACDAHEYLSLIHI